MNREAHDILRAGTASFGERVANRFSQRRYAAPLMALSLAAISWSLFVRLPQCSKSVAARPIEGGRSQFVANVQTVRDVERQAQAAARQLIHEPAEFPRLISRLEESAGALGFQSQVTIKPVTTNAFGFKELTAHPVLFRLENARQQRESGYARLLQWLRSAADLGRTVETRALSLGSQSDGLAWAQIEFNLWSIDDQPAKK